MMKGKEQALRWLNSLSLQGLSGIHTRQDDDQFREKLVALLEGLECRNIEELIELGKVGDYRMLGERMAKRIKLLRKFLDEIEDDGAA